jgi:hypothetical protein
VFSIIRVYSQPSRTRSKQGQLDTKTVVLPDLFTAHPKSGKKKPETRRYSLSLAGLRTQEHEPVGSASCGDFPAYASVGMPRLFSNTAARQFRILTGFPIP